MPADTVAEFEDLTAAKRIERIADLVIVERMRSNDFDGNDPLWRQLSEALAEYGMAVLVAWGVTGALLGHVARHGGLSASKAPRILRLNEDEAQSLATEILIKALPNFRTKSLTRWSPTGGASLKTYFIGRCLMEFAGAYWPWHRRERRLPPSEPPVIDDGRYGSRPDLQAEARILTDALLDGDPDLRRILEMRADGYPNKVIAQEVASTEAAVKSRVHRFRERVERGLNEEAADG